MEPPGPIPNPEVKRICADGSRTIGPARVGRRQVYKPHLVNHTRWGFLFLYRCFLMSHWMLQYHYTLTTISESENSVYLIATLTRHVACKAWREYSAHLKCHLDLIIALTLPVPSTLFTSCDSQVRMDSHHRRLQRFLSKWEMPRKSIILKPDSSNIYFLGFLSRVFVV